MDFTATVEATTDVGPDTVAVSLTAPPAFDAKPGQFVKLSATLDGESVSRFYTVSSPDTDGTFETTVGLDDGDDEDGEDGDDGDDEKASDDGAEDDDPDFAEYLVAREVGDEIDVSGPFGDQFYESEARAVVLAGGPGVGPAVAIAERALAAGNEAAVVYRSDAPAHTDRLDALHERGVSVTVTDGEIGAAVADAVRGADGERAFVYGFAEFVADAEAALSAAGYDVDDAKVENFG